MKKENIDYPDNLINDIIKNSYLKYAYNELDPSKIKEKIINKLEDPNFNERLRNIIKMKYQEGLNLKEISKKINLSESYIKSTLIGRALCKLSLNSSDISSIKEEKEKKNMMTKTEYAKSILEDYCKQYLNGIDPSTINDWSKFMYTSSNLAVALEFLDMLNEEDKVYSSERGGIVATYIDKNDPTNISMLSVRDILSMLPD